MLNPRASAAALFGSAAPAPPPSPFVDAATVLAVGQRLGAPPGRPALSGRGLHALRPLGRARRPPRELVERGLDRRQAPGDSVRLVGDLVDLALDVDHELG